MGTDAILTSKKKRLYCYIDRKYNVDIDGNCEYDEWEEGVSQKRAMELLQQILKRSVGDDTPVNKWGMLESEVPHRGNVLKAIRFTESLESDDIVKLLDDSGYRGDEYWYIRDAQHAIDYPSQREDNPEDEPFYDPAYLDWREWNETA